MTLKQAGRVLAKLALVLPGGKPAWGGPDAGWCLVWDRPLTNGDQKLIDGAISLVLKDGLP